MRKAVLGLVFDISVGHSAIYLCQMLNLLDVLNRYPYHSGDDHDYPATVGSLSTRPKPHLNTIHVMMYIFPRQFGLHNVFTCDVDPRETVQDFKDYTLREDEIGQKYPSSSTAKVPKRLRGKVVSLVQKLQIQHKRCPYKELLEYYCPVSSRHFPVAFLR
jgi:telomerase reverse transcriptase